MTNTKSCIYGLPDCTTKITREHIISKAALKAVFGDEIRNSLSGDIYGNRVLFDQEAVTRSVCDRCNHSLSPYDIAGAELVTELMDFHDPTGKTVSFTEATLRWLLKTHLNHFDVSRDRETGERYNLPFDLRRSLIYRKPLRHDRLALFVDAWQGNSDFWNADSEKKIQFFSYRSIRFVRQKIVLSSFRVKMIDFVLLIPYQDDYRDFEHRISSVMAEVMRDFQHGERRRIKTAQVTRSGKLALKPVVPLSEVMKWIRFHPTPSDTVSGTN